MPSSTTSKRRSSTSRRTRRRRLITPEDFHRFRFVGDPQIAPDGSRVVFVHKTIGEKNEYVTDLWSVDTSGHGTARPFTQGGKDSQPRFAPDGGAIAFVREHEGAKQIHLIGTEGGEARRLTSFPEGSIGSFAWSPDGRKLAVRYRQTDAERTKKAQKEREERGLNDPPWVIEDWWYRLDGDGYFGAARYKLYIVDAETGEHRLLYGKDTLGEFTFDFSPDGRTIAVATNRDRKALIKPWKCELVKINVGSGRVTSVRGIPPGPIGNPRFSPDGKRIAFTSRTGSKDWDYSTENLELWICDASGGKARSLTGKTDYCMMASSLSDVGEVSFAPNIRWAPDGRRIYMEIGWHGETHVASVAPRGGPVTFHTRGAGAFRVSSISGDGRLMAMTTGTPVRLPEVAVARTGAGAFDVHTLTKLNADLLGELEVARPRSRWVRSADGNRVHVWTMDPPRKGRGRHPAVLEIHGGPHAQYGCDFFHEFQVLAAAGYTVVYSNPRGSKGYGRDHCAAIQGSWGGADWTDLQGVTEFMRGLPGVDPDRLAVMGGSYGGYMTNWIIGHTNEFRAAITDRCVSNLHSMFGNSDFISRPDEYWPGNSWSAPEVRWEQSPLKYFGNVKTPTLIIHSEGDLRCNVEQADQIFAALKLRNVPTRFVRYPRSTSHGMSRGGPPDMRLHRLGEILGWLEKWL